MAIDRQRSIAPPLVVGTVWRVPILLAFVATIDQATKVLVRNAMDVCTTQGAVGCDTAGPGDVVRLLRVENAGSSLGFGQGAGIWLILAVAGLMLIPLFRVTAKRRRMASVGAAMMAGGALTNLYDRAVYGSVTDFIAIADTIVINLADVALVVGMVLLTRASLGGARAETSDPVALTR